MCPGTNKLPQRFPQQFCARIPLKASPSRRRLFLLLVQIQPPQPLLSFWPVHFTAAHTNPQAGWPKSSARTPVRMRCEESTYYPDLIDQKHAESETENSGCQSETRAEVGIPAPEKTERRSDADG